MKKKESETLITKETTEENVDNFSAEDGTTLLGPDGERIEEEDKCKKRPEDEEEKEDEAGMVQRYDTMDAPEWMTSPFQKTDEGFLTGRPIVTNVGVFIYRDREGNEVRELRPPEEVFDRMSIESLKLKPLTNDHPLTLVTSENVKDLQVGSLGSNPSADPTWNGEPNGSYEVWDGKNGKLPPTDRFHLAIDMTITDAQAVTDVENGKRELSCGYRARVEDKSGVWMGIPYDKIQRNIRYNHVAIVDKARAGDAARIRMDSADAICVGKINSNTEDVMKTIELEGVKYDAEAKVIETITITQKALETKTDEFNTLKTDTDKQISGLEAERDSFKEKADEFEAKIKELTEKADDQEKIDQAVKARLDILDSAKKAGVEVKDDQSEMDIKKAVIMKLSPNVKLDEKSDDYINVRFDIAKEDLVDSNANTNENIQTVFDDGKIKEVVDSSKAHEDYEKNLSDAWKEGGK